MKIMFPSYTIFIVFLKQEKQIKFVFEVFYSLTISLTANSVNPFYAFRKIRRNK